MGDSHNWKPGERPGGSPSPHDPAAPRTKPAPAPSSAPPGRDPGAQSGRVIHDERGNAVWDWLKDTARTAIDSTSRLLRRLEVPELKVEDTNEQELRIESDRDAGGGYDPYGGSGNSRNRGSSAGLSGGGTRGKVASSRGGATNTGARGGVTKDAGGGYDPYGKGITGKTIPKRR